MIGTTTYDPHPTWPMSIWATGVSASGTNARNQNSCVAIWCAADAAVPSRCEWPNHAPRSPLARHHIAHDAGEPGWTRRTKVKKKATGFGVRLSFHGGFFHVWLTSRTAETPPTPTTSREPLGPKHTERSTLCRAYSTYRGDGRRQQPRQHDADVAQQQQHGAGAQRLELLPCRNLHARQQR
jgi:hypothetical protein